MATAKERQEDFIERLDEMGITPWVKITNQNEIPERVNIEISSDTPFKPETMNYTVMGLIAHFVNRKWAKGWNYTYIAKTHHSITFTNESD